MLERVVFQVPHSIRPDLRVLPAGAPVCDWSSDSAQACEQKLAQYLLWESDGRPKGQAVCLLEDADSQEALQSILPMLARELEHWRLEFDAAGTACLLEVLLNGVLYLRMTRSAQAQWHAVAGDSRLTAVINIREPHCRLWWAIGFLLHEDLVLIRRDSAHEQQVVAECLHVSFPSGWWPEEKLGASFEKIHAPVADSSKLQAAAGALGRAMIERGPFERFVWTICQTPQRARPPSLAVQVPVELSSLWLRYERQVTWPLPQFGRALFFIRVYIVALETVFSEPARRVAILQSLGSMSDAVIDYKGLAHIRHYLNKLA